MSSIVDSSGGRSNPAKGYAMPRTRLSMFYLAGYLLPVGLCLLLVPELTFKLLLASNSYDDLGVRDVGFRIAGILMFGFGMLVVSLIVNEASEVYASTLIVRAFIIPAVFALYAYTGERALLMINAVVCVGWLLTFVSWRQDKAELGK